MKTEEVTTEVEVEEQAEREVVRSILVGGGRGVKRSVRRGGDMPKEEEALKRSAVVCRRGEEEEIGVDVIWEN